MCVLLAFLLALRADALYPFGLDSRVDTFFPANPTPQQINTGVYSVTFSPSGQEMYYLKFGAIYMVEMSSLDGSFVAGRTDDGDTGFEDGFGSNAKFLGDEGAMEMDPLSDGDIYLVEPSNCNVRKISAYEVTTVAGWISSGVRDPGYVDGAATAAKFNYPRDLSVVSTTKGVGPTVYVADCKNNAIRLLDIPARMVTTLAGRNRTQATIDGNLSTAAFAMPTGVAAYRATPQDNVTLFVISGYAGVIRKIDATLGMVTTIAGKAQDLQSVDGPASSARFNKPAVLALDSVEKMIYTVELGLETVTEGSNIRALDLSTLICYRIAGLGNRQPYTDGPASVATFLNPRGVTIGPLLQPHGNRTLFIAEAIEQDIRRVTGKSATPTPPITPTKAPSKAPSKAPITPTKVPTIGPSSPTHAPSPGTGEPAATHSRMSPIIIAVVVLSTTLGACILCFVFFCLYQRRQRQLAESMTIYQYLGSSEGSKQEDVSFVTVAHRRLDKNCHSEAKMGRPIQSAEKPASEPREAVVEPREIKSKCNVSAVVRSSVPPNTPLRYTTHRPSFLMSTEQGFEGANAAPTQRARVICFDAESNTFDQGATVWIKLDNKAFAKGGERRAFRMLMLGGPDGATTLRRAGRDTSPGPRVNVREYVAKVRIDKTGGAQAYYQDVAMQEFARRYALHFNSCAPPKRVSFVRAFVLQLVDRKGAPVCAVERYIPGRYRKHTNNYGFARGKRSTPHAFSHFSYVASRHRYLICDIQGVETDQGDIYTDPQVHSADGKGFGGGNLGVDGFIRFFQSHKCNEVCKYFRLPVVHNAQVSSEGTVPAASHMAAQKIPPVTMSFRGKAPDDADRHVNATARDEDLKASSPRISPESALSSVSLRGADGQAMDQETTQTTTHLSSVELPTDVLF